MRIADTALLLAGTLMLTACASGSGGAESATETGATPAASAATGPALTGILSPMGGSRISGEVTLRPDSRPGRTMARIIINGATPNTEHPWQIKRGQCGDQGAIEIAPLAAYRGLMARGDGAARFEGTINVALPQTPGPMHVEVLRSRSSNVAVSCGMLSIVP